jgi:hypothetical protein
VYPTTAEKYQGAYSLALDVHLDHDNPNLRQGMAFVMLPGNLAGKVITARIQCPTGAAGDTNHRNGAQLFVKDQAFRSQFGPWNNISVELPDGQWGELHLTPSNTTPPGGHTDPGFDPTQVMIVGVKLGVGTGSTVDFQGTCYLDFVNLSREPLIVPASDHIFDFNTLTAEQQRDKPFGYGPYWDVDPGWGAEACKSDDITVKAGELVIPSTFVQ